MAFRCWFKTDSERLSLNGKRFIAIFTASRNTKERTNFYDSLWSLFTAAEAGEIAEPQPSMFSMLHCVWGISNQFFTVCP